MLEIGQPLHAFDRVRVTGPIVVRRARAGERLETLDHVVRDLDPEDIVISDDTGAVGLAGTMGGLTTEIDAESTDLVLEAAHFDPVAVAAHVAPAPARQRGVQAVRARPGPRAAADRLHARGPAARELGGATPRRLRPRSTTSGRRGTSSSTPAAPGRTAGLHDPAGRRGASARGRSAPRWTPRTARAGRSRRRPGAPTSPTRPTSTRRSSGWSATTRFPGCSRTRLPVAGSPTGSGCAAASAWRSRTAGLVETPTYPFMGSATRSTTSGCRPDDTRRHALRLANPLSDAGAAAAHDAAARAAVGAAPQRRSRCRRRRACSRSASWCDPAPTRCRRRPGHRWRGGRPRRRSPPSTPRCRAADPGGGRAGGRARPGGLVG